MNKTKAGTLMVCIASLLFALAGICIKFIPWHPLAINAGRCLVAIIIFAVYLIIRRHKILVNIWTLFGGLCITVTNNLFLFANKMTTAANAIVLQFTVPIFTIFVMWIFYKEKPKKLDIITCFFVFGGVVCFFVESMTIKGGFVETMGNLLALLSGFTYSGMFIMNLFPDGDSTSSTFFGLLFGIIIGSPFLIKETVFSGADYVSDPSPLIAIVILGIFQLGVAFILFSEGIKYTNPVTASIVSGLEPVLNPVLVAIFATGEKADDLGILSLIGCAVVLISILTYNIIKAKKETA